MTDASPFVFSPYKYLFERIGGYVAVIGVIIATTMLWGARPLTEGGSADVLLDILVVGLIAYVAWAVAKIAIDQKIAEAGPYVAAVPGEVGGAGASRLSPLLPLFGNFLLVAIAAVAFMIILTELGVNVTPLFAGAGIVGLAIGFGAQTLVRDILSGVFFLIDDAFRQGEYIDVGDVKGTVEKISIRSFQLRHHKGPLHTIPFGEIRFLTNYSRDWVIMKLPLRVTYDTDVEKVRKLIKKLGIELLDDPVIGQDFIQPLKSQGIIEMQDSAMILRVKFMTTPNEQWLIRKRVFEEIRALFEREGIKFAHRQVTVRLAGENGPDNLTETQKTAIAGAALAAGIDDEAMDENETGGE